MELPREVTLVSSVDQGRRLGRYLLCGELSRGGMGRVYLGRVDGPGGFEKLCAVKVILAEKSDGVMRTMFLDEARIAARITHQNVCPVFDFGDANGVLYLVMEYLEGKPISAVIQALAKRPGARSDPTFPLVAARMLADACEGLHAAHRATDDQGEPLNIVHRDVSPENLFVTYDGAVRVMDFGVARAAGRLQKTEVGSFKGKIAYAPPEAFDAQRLDPRADVWGAGVVLWELMVGASLFTRDSEAATLSAVLRETFPWPSQVHQNLPTEIDHVLYNALRRDREQRYSSCREMARALNRYIASSGTHVGAAELSDWMEALFPEGRGGAAALTREARKLGGSAKNVPQLDASSMDALSLVSEVRKAADSVPVPVAPSLAPVSEPAPSSFAHGDATSVERPSKSQSPSFQAPPSEPVPSHPPSAPSAAPPAPRGRGGRIAIALLVVLVLGAGGVAVGVYLVEWSRGRSSESLEGPQVEQLDSEGETEPESSEEPAPIIQRAEPEPEENGEGAETGDGEGAEAEPDDDTPGTLHVYTVGGSAEVRSDGNVLGRTPVQLSLPPGRHVLMFHTDDRRSFRRVVRVAPGGDSNVSVDIRR